MDYLSHFKYILYNITQGLKFENKEFAYEMLEGLSLKAEEYYNTNLEPKDLKKVKEDIRQILELIDWQIIGQRAISIDKLLG